MKTTTLHSRLAFVAALMIAVLSRAGATSYFISATGNDSLSGTSVTEAWRSIEKINHTDFSPGDKILFEANKLFDGQIYLDSNDGNDGSNPLVISSYGNGKAIINAGNGYGLFAYNTEGITISRLYFTGSGMLENTSDGIIFYADLDGNVQLESIVVEDVDVVDFGERGISIGSWNQLTGYSDVMIHHVSVHHVRKNGIEFYGYFSPSMTGWAHHNVSITHTEVYNVPGYSSGSHKGSGIILAQTENGLIDHCIAHHNGDSNTACGGPGGIWAWDCNKIIIQYCESYSNKTKGNCDGLGFDLDGGVQNSIMQYNYAHDNDGAGFLLGQFPWARDWSNNVVRYNISENNGRKNSGEISLFKAPGTNMKNSRIYNNTVITSRSGQNPELAGFKYIQWANEIDSIEVFNNIFQTSEGAALIDIPSGYDATFAANLYWSSGDSFVIHYHDTTFQSLTDWRLFSNHEQVNGFQTGLTSSPDFDSPSSGSTGQSSNDPDLYKLSPTSPAVNAGMDFGHPYEFEFQQHDFWGNPVPQDNQFDIGAYERIPSETESFTGIVGHGSPSTPKVYPNPVSSGNEVTLQHRFLLSSVSIYSLNGSLLQQTDELQKVSVIHTENLSPGTYILRMVDTNQQVFNQRLIIQ